MLCLNHKKGDRPMNLSRWAIAFLSVEKTCFGSRQSLIFLQIHQYKKLVC